MKKIYKVLLYFGIGALIIYIFFKPIMYLLAFVLFMLGMAFKTIKESFLDGIVYINANILYSTIAITIIVLIGIFFILKRFIKPKKILKYTLIISIPCLIFLRIIPDYSNDFGINITHIFNYNKYNQGYCLKENRILSKEERFKRGIMDFMEKRKIVERMLVDENCKFYGYSSSDCNFGSKKLAVDVGYYKTDKFNNKNWYEVIKNKQDEHNSTLRTVFIEDFNITKTEPNINNIIINFKDNIAGFKKPLILYDGRGGFLLYLKKSFAIGKNFTFNGYANGIYLFGYFLDELKYSDKKDYDNYKAHYGIKIHKIDNCGNMDFNVERYYKENRVNEAG